MTTKPKRAATPWGDAVIVEEVQLKQKVGEKQFASIVQLLEGDRGEQLVRFSYSTDGVTRRGPVTLRARDVARLRELVGRTEALGPALGWEGA